MTSLPNFFDSFLFILSSLVTGPSFMYISSLVVQVSCIYHHWWSKFHVYIITGSGVITIFFYKRLTRNPEIGNTPVWVLPDIWRLGQVTDTKFGTNVLTEILLNAAKYQGYSFYRFWVIKEKPTRGQEGIKLPPAHPD